DWPKVAKALGRWLKLQLTLLRKVEYRRRGAQLWALTRSFIGRRVFKSLRHADQDQLSTLLTDVRRDCDTAKALFQIGSFDEAVTRYAAILEMMGKVDSRITEPSALSAPSPEPQIAELRAERVRVLVNVALCQKKLCRLAESGAAATQALAMEPDHAKALFLRGSVYLAAGNPDPAVLDFARVAALDPESAGARAELQKARAARSTKRGPDFAARIGGNPSKEQIIDLLSESTSYQVV
ncbi:unnamed protein product, partial [Polarella glacialis]